MRLWAWAAHLRPSGRNRPIALRARPGAAWIAAGIILWGAGVAMAATTVKLGSVLQITGPADLDLEGEFVYAINFSADDPVRTVKGIKFLPDSQKITGATLVGPQQVSAWQTKPEFGVSADANQLEEILYDIRWANSGSNERLRATLAVTAGQEYKLQILISANNGEDRRWDIRVNGQEAVDEITSLGASPGQSYARNRATLYRYQFTAPTGSVVVEMGNLFGNNDGADRNPIWQALTLERITNPPAPDEVTLAPDRFFPTQTLPIGRFVAVDRRFGATHVFTLAPGSGDQDNAKFAVSGADLLPGPFDFKTAPLGTTYSIRVRATDTADAKRFLEKTLTVSLAVPHAPSSLGLDAGSMNAMAQPGALVARIQVGDADAFDRHRLELVAGAGDRDKDLFTVAGDELRLAHALVAGQSEARLRLRATDLAGLTSEAAFALPLVPPSVRVNEILASEVAGLADEYSEPQEWVELANELPQHIDLTGWFLTDDPEKLRKWPFPSSALSPAGFLVILADGRGTAPEGSTNLHASFSLDAQGEWIALVRPDGVTVASGLEFPTQYPGVAYGYGTDGRLGHLPKPTPWAPNGAIAEAGQNEVRFSRPHGFYTNQFLLELSATLPDSTIRYTLDGTLPTATSGTLYSGPITLAPTTTGTTRGTRIVRAIAVNARAVNAPVNTQTYLFINGVAGPAVDGVVNQSRLVTSITRHATYGPLLKDAFLALPAVSVVMAGGPATIERLASVELFDPENREEGFQIACGIEATGTTSLGSPKLSMAARFRVEYGSAKLHYPLFARGSLFPARAATVFNEIRLRSHSHDTFYWLGTKENPPVPYGSPAVTRSADAQLTRNPWIDEMQIAMGQPGKHGRQVHLFLNGSYQGIYHIHERPDEDFMAAYFPGPREEFHYTTGGTAGSDHGNGDTWAVTWNNLKASLTTYAQAKRWVDVANLCDYMLLCFYAGNDWDWSELHNWAAAGPRQPDEGGWKFFAQDSDVFLQDVATDCTDQNVPGGLFTSLMRFNDFRVLFRDRVQKHCFGEGMLTPARAGGLYETRMNEIATAIIAETARWQPSSSVGTLPWDRDQEWTNEWRYFRQTFFPQRTARLITQLRQRGWWPLDPPLPGLPEGIVPAGAQINLTSGKGTIYFTIDGSDPRLPGGAINPAAHSTAAGPIAATLIPTGAVWRFLDNGTNPGPTWNLVGFDDSAWKSGPAEIGYGDGAEATTSGYVDADPITAGVQKNITTYFRRTFEVANVAGTTNLALRLLRDDGAAVYLNGREIWRVNLPEGTINPDTRAVTGIGGTDETTFLEASIPVAPVVLKPTGNVLAVEMHQQSPDSSDLSFDFELVGSGASVTSNALVTVKAPTLLRARTYSGADWSGLLEIYYTPEGTPRASAANLVLTEIQYHPLDEPDAEFLEFLNSSTAAIEVSGLIITNAVGFQMPRPTLLEAGERLVVAKDPAVFAARYGTNSSPYFRDGIRVLGPWQGSLSNGGERIDVLGADGALLFSCAYGTDGAWSARADGRGSSLEVVDPAPAPLTPIEKTAWLSDPMNWRPSVAFQGSPGAAGTGPDHRVVVNELLAAPPRGETDAVELLNASDVPVEVSGWFLSDSSANYRKYRLADGLVLAPGTYLVLREIDFNNPANPANLAPFALDAEGESLFLVQAGRDGALLRFADEVVFGPTPAGISLGRFPDGTGSLVWMQAPSLGASNGPPATSYEAWAATAFPLGTAPDLMAPEADPDHDGVSNFAEYAFVLPPDRAGPPPLQLVPTSGPAGLGFAYRTRTGAAELAYQVEISSDLRAWIPAGAEAEEIARTPQTDGATIVTVRLRATVPPRSEPCFVRVRAQRR